MKFGFLISLFLGITAIAQADGYYSYYHSYPHISGYYPVQTPQDPFFYYPPEIQEVISMVEKIPEFQDINDKLDKKSELAIQQNAKKHAQPELGGLEPDNVTAGNIEPVTFDHGGFFVTKEILEDESSRDLGFSEITPSSLILSARKKKFFEKVIPILLKDDRIYYQDRERLEQLFNNLENGNKISAADEIWVKELLRVYRIPRQFLGKKGVINLYRAFNQNPS